MITRKRRIDRKAKEIALQVSFGIPDIKAVMKRYYNALYAPLEHLGEQGKATAIAISKATEAEWITMLSNHLLAGIGFYNGFDKNTASEVAKWTFRQALEEGFLIQSTVNDNMYYLSEKVAIKQRGKSG